MPQGLKPLSCLHGEPKAEALGYLNRNRNCNGDCNCDYGNRRSRSMQVIRRFCGEAGKEVR
jgi:hypothetical protein